MRSSQPDAQPLAFERILTRVREAALLHLGLDVFVFLDSITLLRIRLTPVS
jgi:hypothetical protein